MPGLVTKAISRAHSEEQVLRAPVLLVAKEFRKLFRSKLPPAGVEEHKHGGCPACCAGRQFQQSRFAGHLVRLSAYVARNALQIFIGKRPNGGFLRLADPRNLKFHADFRVFFLVFAWVRVRAVLLAREVFFAGAFLALLATGLARSAAVSRRADFHNRS